jgi:hypothetical protein
MLTNNAHRARRALAALVTLVVVLGAFMLVAEAKKARQGKPKAAPAGAADCKTDADCVVVSDDCCACPQGGKQHAIPKKEKSAYEKDLRKRCSDAACTEVMSQDPTCTQHAMCAAGICELGD